MKKAWGWSFEPHRGEDLEKGLIRYHYTFTHVVYGFIEAQKKGAC